LAQKERVGGMKIPSKWRHIPRTSWEINIYSGGHFRKNLGKGSLPLGSRIKQPAAWYYWHFKASQTTNSLNATYTSRINASCHFNSGFDVEFRRALMWITVNWIFNCFRFNVTIFRLPRCMHCMKYYFICLMASF